MSKPAKLHLQSFLPWVIALALLAVWFYLYRSFGIFAIDDPDRYFHLALAKKSSLEGLVRSWPQVEELGWGNYFPDKEFLFHFATRCLYSAFGETGVLWLVPLASGALLLGLFFLLLSCLPSGQAAMLLLLAVPGTPFFFSRLLLLRPHLFAMDFVLLLLYGILRERPKIIFLSMLLFTLSYHAFYIPLFLLVLACLARWEEKKSWKPLLAPALMGLVLGILLNPYFPSQLVMLWKQLVIAFSQASASGLVFGYELIPLRSDFFLLNFGFHLGLIALFPLFAPLREWRFRFLYLAIFFLWGLAFFSPRAVEYAAIASVLGAGHLLSASKFRARDLGLLLLACLIIQGFSAYQFLASSHEPKVAPQEFLTALKGLENLPDKKVKVFNCDWDISPYVLYAAPEARVLDVLDPMLLKFANPEKHRLRELFRAGQIPDAYAFLRGEFAADYFFCKQRALNEKIAQDPRFERIYPENPIFQQAHPALFRLQSGL